MQSETIQEIENKIEYLKNIMTSWNFEKGTLEYYETKINTLEAELNLVRKME